MKRLREIVAHMRFSSDAGCEDAYAPQRMEMVQQQIAARGIKDERVLSAMKRVPRHLFIPKAVRGSAYEDDPLPIGLGQTISQPYIVAYMTEALHLPLAGASVLEVGTGSSYQTAILAELSAHVFSIEVLPELAARSVALLAKLGYENVDIAVRDGYLGLPEHAPYDGILVAAAARHVPDQLCAQLRPGAHLIIPIAKGSIQYLTLVTKERVGWREEQIMPVRFVPMTGLAQVAG